MQSIFKYLLLLINIDEETILNLFGIENDNNTTHISLTTLKLIVEGLWPKLQDGLNLVEIESVLIFILFIRFLILAIRYNLKTSFYITCIGIIAGYLWYRHLIDIISMYRIVLLKLPWVNKLGVDAIDLRMVNKQMYIKDVDSSEYSHWYNPGQMLYNGFARGILSKQGEINYFIDPVSMIIANLPEPMKSNISPTYYSIYEQGIPKVLGILRKFWNQLSGIAAYTLITRIGKRYCPYLIRWHWTFLLLLSILEQFIVNFVYRCYFFQITVILPKLNLEGSNSLSENLPFQNKILNSCIAIGVIFHIGLILFALLHAIWGQYFYIPFLVENVELHIGPRPANSIYSGGQTAWQDPKEKLFNQKLFNRGIPKLWYGWFGRGTKGNFNILKLFKKLLKSFKR